MDPERAIEFILQQQARFQEQQVQFQEQQVQFQEQHAAFRHELTELTGVVKRIAQQQLDFNQMVGGFHQEYSAALMALAENQKQIQEDHKALSLKVGEIGDKLNGLIAIVDGQIRGPKQ